MINIERPRLDQMSVDGNKTKEMVVVTMGTGKLRKYTNIGVHITSCTGFFPVPQTILDKKVNNRPIQ